MVTLKPGHLFFCRSPGFLPENLALGSLKSDDRQLGRPGASPSFKRWYEVSLFKASDDYVFAAGCNRAGGKRGKQPISLSVVFRYHIKPVADRLGIKPAVFGWHTFRRSFASMVVGSTKDVKAAQELMRHSTSKLTLDLYAQALPENKVQGNCGKPFAATAFDLYRGTKRARRRGTC